MNESGLWALVDAGSTAISLQLRTLPGVSARRELVKECSAELAARLHLELPGWKIELNEYFIPLLSLTAPLIETAPIAVRAEYAAQLEALLDEDEWPVNSLSLVDWTLAPLIKELGSKYQLSVEAHQLQHERLSAAREPYAAAFCNGRWPVKYPDIFTEFYFELDALEHELVRHVIYQFSRTYKYPRPLRSDHRYSEEQVIAAGERLVAKGWLIRSPKLSNEQNRYLRRGKSALLSKNTLL